MVDYIHRYYRDDEELPYENWIELFKADLDKEAECHKWNVRSAVWTDYANGRDSYLNGHEYKARTDEAYNSAKELLESMVYDGKHSELIDAIESFTEAEAEMFVKYISRVKKNNDMFVLEDDEDY